MSDDEQLQIEKDTLWRIHQKGKLIACLEQKISDHIEAAEKYRVAWGRRHAALPTHYRTTLAPP